MSEKRSVFITGTSSGFGLDTALALADRGHTVFATIRGVAGKNSDAAGQLEAKAQENGWDLHVLELDVTDDASVEAAVGSAIAQPGAFGTTFGANMMPAREAERLESYGPAKEMFAAMAKGFEDLEYQDPQEVVNVLADLSESNPGERPLRVPVGAD
jgi:NAD(P)-dependent dehydrogenase (short-subunit alcohol dehydrogenase family)